MVIDINFKKDFLSIEETAQLFGLGYSVIWRQIKNGDLPHIRIGRQYVISQKHIREYIKKLEERNV